MKTWRKSILKVVEIFVITLIAVFCVVTVYQKVFDNAPVFGYRIFVIISDSMKPKLKINDLILVKETEPKNIKVGDIITYQGMEEDVEDKIITHEVVNISKEKGRFIFYTKGEASLTMDPIVYEEQLLGKMQYKFIVISFISKIVRSTYGFIALIAIPLGYLLFIEIKDVRKEIKSKKEQ